MAADALLYGLGYAIGVHLPAIALAGGLGYAALLLIDPALAGMTQDVRRAPRGPPRGRAEPGRRGGVGS